MKTTVIAIALAGMALVPAAQAAEDFPFEFEYSAQDLQTEDGAKQVYEDLREQVKDACEFTNSRRGVAAQMIEKKCVDQAVENTVRRINAKALTIAHDTHEGVTQS